MAGRVLRVVTRLNRGGPLRQLQALVPGLADLDWSGPVLAGRTEPGEPDGTEDLRAAGADVVRIPALARGIDPGADARALAAVLGWIRRVRPDVVHTHTAKAGALGRVAACVARVPAVHTFHGHHFTAGAPAGPLAVLAERALAPLAARLVCLSQRQRTDVVERFRVAGAERVRVVGPGIDVERFLNAADPQEVATIRSRHAEDGRPLFVWAGRFVPVKDPLGAVEAVARSGRGFRLAMLGDGPLRAATAKAAADLGVGGAVRFVGPVASTAAWIRAADAVVLSSRSEGTPIAILEARVLGRCVVATSVGGVPDLVEDGRDGVLVAPGDGAELARALDAVAGDAVLRDRLGAAGGLDAAERFGRVRLAAGTAAVYEEALGGRTAAASIPGQVLARRRP